MDITLSGHTTCFSLIFILKFLNSLKKSGTITLSGNSLNGEIILKEGDVTHAIYDQNKGEDALKALLAMTGNFQFIEGVISEDVTFSEGRGDKILKEAFGEWMDIQELCEVIPLNDVSFSIVPFKERNNQEAITFSREEWMIISHINKYPLYEDLVCNTGLGGLETGKILLDLHKNGYITYITDMTSSQTSKDLPGLNADLSNFKLKDIFNLIIDANVTGNLNIISNGNSVDIYIENQIIMDAKSLSWYGDMAIAEAMSRQTGNCSFFKFTRQDKPDTVITVTCEEIISGSSEKIIKLTEIAEEFKYSDAIFILNEDSDAQGDEEDFAFSKKDLAIMMNIDGKRTLNDLSEHMDTPLYRLVENMYCLYKNGLIKLIEKKEVKDTPPVKDNDSLIDLLHQEDKYDKEQLKATILFSEIDKEFLPFLNTTETENQDDLLSLLNKEDEGQEDIKKSLLSQPSEGDDLLSLLNKEDEGQEDLKKSLLSQSSEGDDLLSLLNKEDEGQEDVRKSLLTGSDSSYNDDLLKLLNDQKVPDKKKN
ncbi:MAG: DUF4388 domain-containing protein [Candidatus Eremiobacterota bacterium]